MTDGVALLVIREPDPGAAHATARELHRARRPDNALGIGVSGRAGGGDETIARLELHVAGDVKGGPGGAGARRPPAIAAYIGRRDAPSLQGACHQPETGASRAARWVHLSLPIDRWLRRACERYIFTS